MYSHSNDIYTDNTINYYIAEDLYYPNTTNFDNITQEEMACDTQADGPTELVKKIEYFIEDILIKLDEGVELEIFVLDLELNSVFNYDFGYFCLPEEAESFKYSKLTLTDNSDKIAKILKIASIIHSKALNKSNYSTKR
jgi:hypothetical protein